MALSEEARKARNEYYRNYRKKNPDKVREWRERANDRYWEKKAAAISHADGDQA